jgi:hypothetical protein
MNTGWTDAEDPFGVPEREDLDAMLAELGLPQRPRRRRQRRARRRARTAR